jgi:hypothetical protein
MIRNASQVLGPNADPTHHSHPKHSKLRPNELVLLLGLSISSHQPSLLWHIGSCCANQIRKPLTRLSTAGNVFLSPSRIGTTRWYNWSRLSELIVTAATKSGQIG